MYLSRSIALLRQWNFSAGTELHGGAPREMNLAEHVIRLARTYINSVVSNYWMKELIIISIHPRRIDILARCTLHVAVTELFKRAVNICAIRVLWHVHARNYAHAIGARIRLRFVRDWRNCGASAIRRFIPLRLVCSLYVSLMGQIDKRGVVR